MAVSKPKYEVFGDELSAEVAFLQAASALDEAAFLAKALQKPDELASVAAVWMELGSRLLQGPGGEEEEEPQEGDEGDPVHTFGFGIPVEELREVAAENV